MNAPAVIPEWDWPYRAGFDAALAGRVALAADRLDHPAERGILLARLAWARGFISLDRLLEALEAGELPAAALETLDQDRVLHLPAGLANVFAARIARLAGPLGDAAGRRMEALLRAALANPYRASWRSLFEPVFGAQLAGLLRRAAAEAPVPHPGFAPLTAAEARSLTRDFLARDFLARNFLARGDARAVPGSLVPSDGIELRFTAEASGFAEYWPRELIGGGPRDRLVVHLNDQSLDRFALEATLCHEVYGHGRFYALLRDSAPPLVDYGAFLLVEGWASLCEWRFAPPAYAAWARWRRLRTLADLDDAGALMAGIEKGIVEDRAAVSRDARLIEGFQYPALAACYALGGLWFEGRMGHGGIEALSALLRGRAWGDFMRAWDR